MATTRTLFCPGDGCPWCRCASVLYDRRDKIVAELAEDGNDSSGKGTTSEPGSKEGGAARRTELLNRRTKVVLELRSLRAKADADRELRDEVLC